MQVHNDRNQIYMLIMSEEIQINLSLYFLAFPDPVILNGAGQIHKRHHREGWTMDQEREHYTGAAALDAITIRLAAAASGENF